ncbi:hypothetical protein TELCIR_07584 [Teladorsagia circumcincta]|uniref:Peptidase C19 ubiquitin carboxyl-terminal hydrolase domain-containing protein n=1 Tax=Teladorsagia circumcincta TaxID=45464 RepID=A0A2G9UJY1_TELCI|nr:hypothetical protein TELCIR_07584 [Teladorsagia circumcincta]
MQQDAHEFLNYLLNTVSETLIEEKNAERDRLLRNGTLRKGTLNTDRGRDETSGYQARMRIFSICLWISTRMLPSHIACESLVKQKHCVETRFKYMDQLSRYTKLSYRVLFPLELRLFNVVRFF